MSLFDCPKNHKSFHSNIRSNNIALTTQLIIGSNFDLFSVIFIFINQYCFQINISEATFKNKTSPMKSFKLLFLFSFVMSVAFTSCLKKDDCEYKSKYIYEPIVFDEECNCIVQGKVKYLVDCKTAALVDYGNGECDNIATKTICVNGKCESSAGAYTEEFEIDCEEPIVEGIISEEEAIAMGI